MVDEGSSVDAPFLRAAQHGVDALLFEPRNELLLVIRFSQYGKYGAFCHVRQLPVPDVLSGTGELLLHGIIADRLSEERGLERIADLVPVAVRGGIDQSAVLTSAHVSLSFLDGHIIKGKKGTVFAHRLETVLPAYRLHGVADLPLDITGGNVHPAQRIFKTLAPAFCRTKPVFLLQLPAYAVTAAKKEIAVEPPAVLIHIDRHDMHMVAVYILVLIYHVWLLPETELLQIFPCDVLQVRIREPVLRVRIERYMHHRFLHPCL